MTLNKWQKLSLAEQMGNIGSEISRAGHWEKMGDFNNREKALGRAIELVDLTLVDKHWPNGLKELVRLREVLGDLMIKANIYNISLKSLEDFCLDFAIMARNS
ncbi:hypothetical protein ISS21_01470 [Patescibacteria group bacterium]|nr:hypothetical protein [Patescibacteria group bacterium]